MTESKKVRTNKVNVFYGEENLKECMEKVIKRRNK